MKKIISVLLVAAFFSSASAYAHISNWAAADFNAANSNGLLSYSVVSRNLQGNITRGEFCELAVNLYSGITQKSPETPEKNPFPDTQNSAAAKAYVLGIVSGDEHGNFNPDLEVTRQEMAKMLYNTLIIAGAQLPLNSSDRKYIKKFDDMDEISSWAVDAMSAMQKYELMNGVSASLLAPAESATREQAIILCERCYSRFSGRRVISNTSAVTLPKNNSSVTGDVDIAWRGTLDAGVYHVIIKDEAADPVYIWQTTDTTVTVPAKTFAAGKEYTLLIGTLSNNGTETFTQYVKFTYTDGAASPAPTAFPTAAPTSAPSPAPSASPKPTAPPSPTASPSSNAKTAQTEKEKRVFPDGTYFVSEEEAKQNMTEITINVWNVGENGEKIASTRKLTVNSELADEIKEIFDEIFSGTEKFPIYSIGGYTWRKSASGNLSQHSYGTCIDINPNENYQITNNGTILSGSLWKPGENQYSIAEDGEVVKIFAKYGWAWGGNAWNSSRDYMHFTYLGN